MGLNFLYVSDNGYFDLMRLSIVSAIKHHKGVVFHVFTMDSPETNQKQIPGQNRKKLEREIFILDPTAKIVYYDVRDMYLEKLANSVNKDTRFSPYAALRMLAPYVIADVDLLLYLDADTVVVESLEELFIDYCDQDFDIAATIANNGVGIQSGALLLNLRYQQSTNFSFMDETINLYNNVKYEFPDQDAISAAGKVMITLHGRYMQQNYATGYNKPKVLGVCYRNNKGVETFLKQSIFRLDAQRIYNQIDRIAMLVSDIQN